MRILLMFCYILICTFFVSCGENNSQNEQKTQQEIVTPKVQSQTETRVILFYGTSLTAGLGLSSQEAYPAIIQQRIDSLNLNYKVVNAGLSGETTAGGKNRLDWVMNQDVDIFVLELGANDGLRGVPLQETRKNLQEIIDSVKEKKPNATIILAGMQIPPNMGEAYASGFRDMFFELSAKNNTLLIPFLLDGVGGDPAMNLPDGIHPNAKGQKILADNVWAVLEPELSE